MNRSLLTLTLLSTFFIFGQLYATDSLVQYGIRPGGKIMEIKLNPQESYSNIFTAYDSDKNRYFVRVHDEIYTYDLTTNIWESFLKMNELQDQEFRMDYSSYHKGLLFWDAGVGRVFLLDSTKTITRIDKSFIHRNQFGHGWWIDSITGSIYTFGGYGLFTMKSFITEFNPVLKEWNDVIFNNIPESPAPQIEPIVFPTSDRNKVYMLANKLRNAEWYANPTSPSTREKGFWEFDKSKKIWTYLADLEMGTFNQLPVYQRLNRTHYSVHPRLPIFLFATSDEATFSKGFYFFDFEKRVTHLLSDLLPDVRDPYYHLSINWSEHDDAYQILALDWNFNTQILRIIPMELRINDEEAFAEWLSESEENRFIPAIIILSIFGLIPILVFRIRNRSRNSVESSVANQTPLDRIRLLFNTDSTITIEFRNQIITEIQGNELKLLSILATTLGKNGTYISAEQIEQELLPDHPSQDYTRRFRNLSIDRLESSLKSIIPDSKGDFIIKRPVASDKRKFEYRLNDKLVELITLIS